MGCCRVSHLFILSETLVAGCLRQSSAAAVAGSRGADFCGLHGVRATIATISGRAHAWPTFTLKGNKVFPSRLEERDTGNRPGAPFGPSKNSFRVSLIRRI